MSMWENSLVVLVLLAAGLLLPTVGAAQTTWHVDDDAPGDPGPADPDVSDPAEDGTGDHPFDAIQEALDAARDGDTVLVAAGTYTGTGNKNLDPAGKTITIRSATGPDDCVIDCQQDGRGFYVHSGETLDTVIDGFTIQNGRAASDGPDGANGAGIRCHESSLTMVNCIISKNKTCDWQAAGGGVSCRNGDLTLTDCTIVHNHAVFGGGVYCFGGYLTITGCSVTGNHGAYSDDGYAGGIYCGPATIRDCTIARNSSGTEYGWGGGVCCRGVVTIANCSIVDNSVHASPIMGGGGLCGGGGVDCWGNTTITNCVIARNSFNVWYGGGGAGVYCRGTTTIANCSITDNEGNSEDLAKGGGVMSSGTLTITDCTIAGNSLAGSYEYSQGGGICCEGQATITNCTVVDNEARSRFDAKGGGLGCSGNTTITDCILAGNSVRATYDAHGGGVWAGKATPEDPAPTTTISNCRISNNIAQSSGDAWWLIGTGGGAHVDSGQATIRNCTITANQASHAGNAISQTDGQATIANTIIWNNTQSAQPLELGTAAISYCDIEGGPVAGEGIDWVLGNIDADPLFVDPNDADYRLLASSPCVDAGDNAAVAEDHSTDVDGYPRFIDDPNTPDTGDGTPPIVDMGAHEWPSQPDCNGNGNPDGWDIAAGTSADCNENGVPDECDVADGTSEDCNENGIPDECDIATGTSSDCNENGTPDECETDCNENGVPDDCDIAAGTSSDCNENGVPDECDVADGTSEDCNENGVPDECEDTESDAPPAPLCCTVPLLLLLIPILLATRRLYMPNIPSAVIARVGDTGGAAMGGRGFRVTCVRTG